MHISVEWRLLNFICTVHVFSRPYCIVPTCLQFYERLIIWCTSTVDCCCGEFTISKVTIVESWLQLYNFTTLQSLARYWSFLGLNSITTAEVWAQIYMDIYKHAWQRYVLVRNCPEMTGRSGYWMIWFDDLKIMIWIKFWWFDLIWNHFKNLGFDFKKSRKKSNHLIILKSQKFSDQKMTVNKIKLGCPQSTSTSPYFFPACTLVTNELLTARGVFKCFWMWFSARKDISLS